MWPISNRLCTHPGVIWRLKIARKSKFLLGATSYFYSFFVFVKNKNKKKTRHLSPWSDLHFLAQFFFRSSFLCSHHLPNSKMDFMKVFDQMVREMWVYPSFQSIPLRLKLDCVWIRIRLDHMLIFSDWFFFSLTERGRWISKFCRFQRWSKRWIHLNPFYVFKKSLHIAWLIDMQIDLSAECVRMLNNVFLVDILDPSSGLGSLEFESNELQVKLETWRFY